MNIIHMRKFRNIPPLQYLLGFEAAARLGSFSRAAEELGLSQSAVSHEMRLLEARIGQPLFIRQGRSIRLTDAGRDYQRSVMTSLEHLESGHQRLEPYRKPGSVVIYAPRDFASRWLMPRLDLLRQAVPDCDPWIDTSGTAIDFDEVEVSIAIVKAREIDTKWESHLLMSDHLTPVVSPNFIFKQRGISADVQNYPLLHDEGPKKWRDWFEAAGIARSDVTAGIDFSDSDLAINAAERGLGMSLASVMLTQESISAGLLVKPSPITLDTNLNWYVVSNQTELGNPVTQKVWTWLIAQTGA